MKKIKLFLITLLCVVGVMNVAAQDVTVDVNRAMGNITGSNTWTSNANVVLEGGYDLKVVDPYAVVGRYGMSWSDNGRGSDISVGVEGLFADVTRDVNIVAPLGYIITGFEFVPSCSRADVLYQNTTCPNNVRLSKSGLSQLEVTVQVESQRTLLAGSAVFKNFKVYLKKLEANPADERLNDGSITYWEWNQEIPVKNGGFYKFVNYTLYNSMIQAVGQSTRTIVNSIEEAGEWLYAEDRTITIVSGSDPAPKPIYDGILSDDDTGWDIKARVEGENWLGCQISAAPVVNTYYIVAEENEMKDPHVYDFPASPGDPDLPNKDYTVWNFYSMEQYYCYEDYKSAYEAFMAITDVNPDYADEYNALKAEVDGYTARGNTDENRDAAYAMIQKMLDMVAILGGIVEPGRPLNFDAENAVSMEYWRVRRVAEKGEDTWAVADDEAKLNGNKGFDIRNCTMSQSIRNLEPGIYKVSVWWQAGRTNNDNASVNVVLNAASNADNQSVTLIGEGVKWQQAEIEVVVVDGRLTISATANTGAVGGWVNLDDFALTYVTKNRVSTDATKTTVYQGVFDDSDNIAVVTKENPYADITAAYGAYFKFDNTQNLNGLCYAKNGKVVKVFGDITKDACNVVRDGKCANLVLKNGYPYSTKKAFTAADAKYDMTSFGVGVDNAGENITFGTMILPYAVGSIPSDVKVYSATSVSEDGNLTLSQVSSVEANIPYLVEYTGSANPLFEAYSTNKPIGIESVGQLHQEDMLVGAYQLTEVENDGTNYLLQKQNGKLAFYRVASAGLNVGPFRCYLHVPSAVNAPSKINIVFDDEVTGITEVEDADCADVVYDIQGRRVENAVRPGIYVKNGKKYLVK